MIIEWDDEYFDDEELKNTPKRIAKFFQEWKNNQNFDFTTFENPGYNQMITLKNIIFFSICAHHLLPFYGRAHIAYVPNGRVCGISKLSRVVKKFASRPQSQERMTQEIADFIEEKLHPKGMMVIVEGQHLCMIMRGIKEPNTWMITSALKGVFANSPEGHNPREEFLRLIEVMQ